MAVCIYTPELTDQLTTLLNRLNAHRRTLIMAMAKHDRLPAGSDLCQVGERDRRGYG